jgi:predicted secreted protein
MKKIIILNILFILSARVDAAPTLTSVTSSGTTIKFVATLTESLPAGYKVKIDYSNGKGLVAMTCSALKCSLSSNSLPKDVSSAVYKIGIYNAQNIVQGAIIEGTYVIISPYSTGYSKISNTGIVISDLTKLGSSANDWACTRDNKTGLIWEVKTMDSGLRDMNNTYTNYFEGETGYGVNSNIDYYVNSVNIQALCGANNWRLPTKEELKDLIFCSDNEYTNIGGSVCKNSISVTKPTINLIYFPNTQSRLFWTSSTASSNDNGTWSVYFDGGSSVYYGKNSKNYIRLVHDDKSSTNVQNTGVDKTSNDSLTSLKTSVEKTAADYLKELKISADKTASEYLNSLKSSVEKTAADYLKDLKINADRTVSEYLKDQKSLADNTAAEYLVSLKLATTSSISTSSNYTKISNSGAVLPDTAKLGGGINDWACTRDNKKGYIWEVKTTDDGLRDMYKAYTNYNPDETGYGKSYNSDVFVSTVNKQKLCGGANWRLPTLDELKTLVVVVCADGKYEKNGDCTNLPSLIEPAIDSTYFPNTVDSSYWSSSYYYPPTYKEAGVIDFSWSWSFSQSNNKTYFIRLVRYSIP